MPYAFQYQKKKLPRNLDRRVKLSEEDKEQIRYLHKQGTPLRQIARQYAHKCTRRAIQFMLFPERYAVQKANAKKRRAIKGNTLQEYGKEAWAKTMREHRRYKQSIKNKLI